MSNLKKSFLMGGAAAGAALVASAFFSVLAVHAACTNPATIPSGFAAPCPVFSLSSTSVTQAQTLTLSATPQAGTDYIYTQAYVSNGTTWSPYTLAGNNAYPSYSSALASLTLSSTQLSSLSLGTHYAVVWNWLWDSTAQCYKGPGLNQCNTGQWRVQSFSLTSSATPTPTPTYTYSQSSYYAYSQSAYTNTLTFGYATQGANIGTTMSNSVWASKYAPTQSGTVNSISVFVASPVSASPNNLFQVAIYADNAGIPGALIAKSASQTITPDAWSTIALSAPIAASTPYWLAYNTNGLDGAHNNLRYDAGTAPGAWITPPTPFGTWPATFSPIGGTSSINVSIYATYTPGTYAYSQSAYYAYSQSSYYAYSQSAYYAYSQSAYATTVINVKNSPYNAKGDGVTDDTAAINSAKRHPSIWAWASSNWSAATRK